MHGCFKNYCSLPYTVDHVSVYAGGTFFRTRRLRRVMPYRVRKNSRSLIAGGR